MTKESKILEIVKEDVLRILGERDSKKTSLEFLKSEIEVSDFFIFTAVEKLEKENLIKPEENFILLTQKGKEAAENIIKKHFIIKNYFKETKSERRAHEIAHILEHYISEEVVKNIEKLSTFREKGISLTELGLQEESLITDIAIPDNELFERIVSMGMVPGEKIRVTNEISGSIIVKVKNKKFALDKNIAKEIKVLKQ